MAKVKISLITTVLNEEKTIKSLLQSIEVQTKKPDEIIIVDAGSTDRTVSLIKNFPLKIKILKKLGNRAVGRNFGIKKAVGQGIAVTDVGCVLDKNWFKRITEPLVLKKADVVAGFYHMNTDTLFTQCSAPFVGITSADNDFLPSSRSIAFTKKAWAKIGGYPEHLDFAEDLIFARKLKNHMVFEPQAIVNWTPPKNLFEFFTAIKNYTRGNIQARYRPHLYKNLLVALRYLFLPLMLLLLPIYFVYTTIKFRRHLRHPLAPNLLFVLQLTADMAVITALLQGVYDSTFPARPRPTRS
jgi:glycosyltransferase involved in cell wall biosynthesis